VSTLRGNTLRIATPEGVAFSLELAGPIRRMLAWMLDVIIVIPLCLVVLFVALLLLGWRDPIWMKAAWIFSVALLPILYSSLLEWLWAGQTIGKRVLGIRVADEQGLDLQRTQVIVRNLVRIVDRMPVVYFVGGAAMLLSRRAQRLGDVAAGTVVILSRSAPPPDLDQIGPRVFNSLRDHPHIVGRLRQRVRPAEAALAVQALLRRNELAPEARLMLFARLAEHFRRLVPPPRRTVEGLSDEQYVRNVVDAMYRRD
jgi:uncharacterized RDD family membrane protein YckC